MSEENSDLDQRVAEWISNEGYRLEYLTHKALKDAGLNALMSHYVTSAEGKPREVDVTASHTTLLEKSVIVLRLLCECKYSVDSPWVLMTSDVHSQMEMDWVSTPRSKNLRDNVVGVIKAGDRLKSTWHFAQGHLFGHTLVQALRKNNRDAAFEALQKIANAAWDSVESPIEGEYVAHRVALPCIIVDAPLFLARLDYSTGQFITKRVPYGRLSWAGCRNGTMVDVIHAAALGEYARAVRVTFDAMAHVVADLVKEPG